MDKNRILKSLLYCFILGGVFSLLKQGTGFTFTNLMVIALGLLVAFVDYFCLEPFYNLAINKKIRDEGIQTEAYIEKVVSRVIHPNSLVVGDDGKPAMPDDITNAYMAFTVTVSYNADGQEIMRNIITPYATGGQIAPYVFHDGHRIPVKYHPTKPKKVLVDIPAMMESSVEGQKKLLRRGPFFAFVITTIYVFYVVTRFVL